jgi:hypothetical protein
MHPDPVGIYKSMVEFRHEERLSGERFSTDLDDAEFQDHQP